MLTFEKVEMSGGDGPGPIFTDLTFTLGWRRVMVIAEDDELTAGFVNLLVGVRRPDRGQVRLGGRTSWPIGQQTIMRSAMNGRETIRFLSLIYNLDAGACTEDALRWFSPELMARPMTRWSGRERNQFERLAVLWPDFDILLAYGAGPTGDPEFDAEWRQRFVEKMQGRGLIAVAPPFEPWSEWCDVVLLLRGAGAIWYASVAEAQSAVRAAATGALVEDSPKRRGEQIDDDLI